MPAVAYTAAAWTANLAATLAPDAWALLLATFVLWLFAGLLFFAVVVWFRDDDWLAAGFLLGVTLLLSAWTSDVLAQAVVARSIVPAVFAAPGALLAVIVRGVIGVPLLGGLVALLRWVTRKWRSMRRSPQSSESPSAR